jgi:protoheme IX farnesyltransferase
MSALTKHLETTGADLRAKLCAYWPLIKSPQTGLLLVTGVTGFVSAGCPRGSGVILVALVGSLFLAICGSTVLNMVYDRDIDARMERTCQRPLPAGRVDAYEALLVGAALAWLGVGWAFALAPLYGLVVLAGLFFDVVVYTLWLKRRTAWSIVWGGIAGGMPALAGRVLGVGRLDGVGLLLALAVLLWIPTHILTYGMKYAQDYRRAGVPILPNTQGEGRTRLIIGLSTAAAVAVMLLVLGQIGLTWYCLRVAGGLGLVLLGVAAASLIQRSPKLNFLLFKLASLYMLAAMVLIMVGR